RFVAFKLIHLGHVRFCIFVHHTVDSRSKELVAAGVVAMRVCVDDRGHRLIRDGLDSLEKRWSPSRQFGIDNDDAGIGDEYRGVAAAEGILIRYARSADDIQIVFHLFYFRRCECAGDGPWNPDTTSGKQPNTTMIPSTI